ncbi:hypothetical protein [Gluconobacter albidus]|uniref:hypothetical protein n=1 Tax=Gluconobacter albidus TaxID=318683 RepID=UPI00309F07D4
MSVYRESPPIKEIDLDLKSDPKDIINSFIRRGDFKHSNPQNNRSFKECFFGKIIGNDINSITEQVRGHNRYYRENDRNGPTRYRPFEELFSIARPMLNAMKDFEVIYNHAVDFIFSSTEHHIGRKEIIAGLQCNVNMYTRKSDLKPHRDDLDDDARTFYPASATIAFSTEAEPPAFFLWYAGATRDGKPKVRGVNNDTPESIGSGNGVLFGLHGESYLYGKHSAYLGNLGGGTRISLNFRSVRRELRDLVNSVSPRGRWHE